MLFTKTLTGTYGSGKTSCFILTANDSYLTYYCVEGSKMVNQTYDTLKDGCDVEEVSDFDCFTWSSEINTLEELENAINDEEEEEVFAADGSNSIEPGCDSTVQVQSTMPIAEMIEMQHSISDSYNRWKDEIDKITSSELKLVDVSGELKILDKIDAPTRDKILEGNPNNYLVSFEPTDIIKGWDKIDTTPREEEVEYISEEEAKSKTANPNLSVDIKTGASTYQSNPPAQTEEPIVTAQQLADWRNTIRKDVVNIGGKLSPLPSDAEEYGRVGTTPGEEEPEPTKLQAGMLYKITSLKYGDAFTGDLNRGELTGLKYLNSENNMDFFKYLYDATINFIPGFTWELLPDQPAVQECDATDAK